MPASRELIVSYRERISELHSQCVAADQAVRDALANKIDLAKKTGETIQAAKGDLREREFAEATDFLSSDAVRAYLKLVRLHPEPVTDLETSLRTVRETLMTTGALDFPAGHGPQRFHTPNFFSQAIAWAQAIAAAYTKFCNRHQLTKWDNSEIDGLLATLQPVLRICRSLNAEIQRRRQ